MDNYRFIYARFLLFLRPSKKNRYCRVLIVDWPFKI